MAMDGLYAGNAGAIVDDGQGARWVRSVIERSSSKQLLAMPEMTSAHSTDPHQQLAHINSWPTSTAGPHQPL